MFFIYAQLITYFGNFIFRLLIIQDNRNHLLLNYSNTCHKKSRLPQFPFHCFVFFQEDVNQVTLLGILTLIPGRKSSNLDNFEKVIYVTQIDKNHTFLESYVKMNQNFESSLLTNYSVIKSQSSNFSALKQLKNLF